MTLRRRLVAGIIVVLIGAIVTTDLVTLSELRSFLYGRIDEQVDVAQSQAYTYIELTYQRAVAAGTGNVASDPAAWLAELSLPSATPLDLPTAGSPSSTEPTSTAPSTPLSASQRVGRLSSSVLAARISPDIYTEVVSSTKAVVFRRPSGSSDQADPAPTLPRQLPVRSGPPVHRFGTNHGAYLPDQPSFTAGAKGSGGGYYEGEALSVPGGTLITMIPLAPTNQTLASLTRDEVVVSVVVALVLLVLILVIVRFSLRPLDEMTSAARAIAEGDMRRRIRRMDDRSEVGKLGAALNSMLGQIDTAMAERTTSEARLRRFVADASHELRTPLTSIRGYAELLQKGVFEDEAGRARAVERIGDEARRMGELVDELLLLARLDQGRPLERTRLDFGDVVADAVDAARAAAPDRRITAELEPLVMVDGDERRLRQVADNLLRNAIVHTPPGTPVVVTVVSRPGWAELVVADQGPGLGPDQAARVFDRFYRGNEARGRPGTGLGLSIVAALAAAHGGGARVRSVAGSGSEFVVELPLAADNIEADGRRRAEPARR